MNFDFSTFDWQSMVVTYGLALVKCVAIILIGFWLIGIIGKMVKSKMEKSKVDPSLKGFLTSIIVAALKILVVITALGQLGMEMTSFVAIIGAAGLAIGLALSGTLQNFAGGVLLLLLKPFKVGDVITAQGHTGMVKEISIFITTLLAADKRTILIPNGPLANNDVVNFTTEPVRRVDVPMGIGYGDDIVEARKVLLEILHAHPLVADEPAPHIVVTGHGDSCVNLSVRSFCKQEDYWTVNFEVMEQGKYALDAAGIEIPFPQRVIHQAPVAQ